MRRIALILTLLALSLSAAAQVDSLRFERLDSALTYYTAAMEPLDVVAKGQECDFIIGTASDSLDIQHIALWLWDHYKESRLMGEEAVAIHIYDKWFKTGKVAMRSEFDRMDADIFVTFNRSTLLGSRAPVIALRNPRGRSVEIPSDGTYSILYFYDTSCGKCKVESKLLPSVLAKVDFPATFYAVYAGSEKQSWRRFRREFKVKNRNLDVVHLWDPDIESDYLRLYGVMSTPRLYVTDEEGVILGRRLEVENLQEIIHYICISHGQKEN